MKIRIKFVPNELGKDDKVELRRRQVRAATPVVSAGVRALVKLLFGKFGK